MLFLIVYGKEKYYMKDIKHARLMLDMARKDFNALEGMNNVEIFDDEIFGFHAQQAVEKTIKAWLSLVGASYPKIHDLEELLHFWNNMGKLFLNNFIFWLILLTLLFNIVMNLLRT